MEKKRYSVIRKKGEENLKKNENKSKGAVEKKRIKTKNSCIWGEEERKGKEGNCPANSEF